MHSLASLLFIFCINLQESAHGFLYGAPRQVLNKVPVHTKIRSSVSDEVLSLVEEVIPKAAATTLTPQAVTLISDCMNRDNALDLKAYVLAYTELGTEAAKANAWTQGAFVIQNAKLMGLDGESLEIRVNVARRSFFGASKTTTETVRVKYPWPVKLTTAEGVKRCLMEMSRRQGLVSATATIYNIPVGSYGGLPKNLKLNNVPHSSLARTLVYRGASLAVVNAIADTSCPRRMVVRCTIPELNFEMDTYRVGTMLEMVREIVTACGECGYRTKVCIQGSMGEGIFTGLPLSLSGTRAIMEKMDWGDSVGKSVFFGKIGADFVEPEDDVFLCIAPMSMIGASIHGPLAEMAAAVNGKPLILINPNLRDRPSSAGIMGVRGRGDRLEFEQSFSDIYNFRLVYPSSAAYYPIKGAVMKHGHNEPYVLFKREDKDDGSEVYTPIGSFDNDPKSDDISPLF